MKRLIRAYIIIIICLLAGSATASVSPQHFTKDEIHLFQYQPICRRVYKARRKIFSRSGIHELHDIGKPSRMDRQYGPHSGETSPCKAYHPF